MKFLEQYALVLLLVGVCLFFGIYSGTSDVFFSLGNCRTVGGNQAVPVVLALAVVVPLTCGQYDLSVGANAGLCSIAAASISAKHHCPLLLAIAATVAIGGAVGLINGLLVARCGLNSLIATLGTTSVVAGVVSWYTNNETIINGIPESLTNFGNTNVVGVPYVVLPVIVIAIAVYYMLEHTPFGRYLASVGSNSESSKLVGIRTERVVLGSLVTSGLLSGMAGVLLLARLGSATPQTGPGYTLAALSAAFLGSTAIKPGVFNVPGAIVGVIFVAISINGLGLAGAADWVQPTFTGLALILAVAISLTIAKRRMSGPTSYLRRRRITRKGQSAHVQQKGEK